MELDRDYIDPGHTQVHWFDDTMVILSPGTLVPPLRPEDLKRPHRSYLRNPKIAEAFYFAGWIEQWGTGVGEMRDEFCQAGLPEPEWEEAQGAVWLTFRKDILTEEHLKTMGLNKRQIRAVLWVKMHGRITNSEYQALLQVSKRTASDDLRWLERAGLLEKVGTKGAKGVVKGQQRGKTNHPHLLHERKYSRGRYFANWSEGMKETLEKAKAIITEEVERAGYQVLRILLFGSRARGEARPDSDWDFFVITDREPTYPELRDMATRIRRRFVKAGFWGDVFVQSEEVAQKRKENTGFLTYYVLKEGVEI